MDFSKADHMPFVGLNLEICYETFWLFIKKCAYKDTY